MSASRRARLADAVDVLLDEAAPPFRWAEATRGLATLLHEITGAGDPLGPDQPTPLASGLALSPTAAARCLEDFVRTARFAQGLVAAVEETTARFEAPVEVLYAGCGPFALLALPLLARGGPARVTLVDVHETSLASAHAVVDGCGLGAGVVAYVAADATAYRHPRPLHVGLSETMGQALEREPQVAVMANLASQLAPGGRLVPERVRVEACLADAAREFGGTGDVPERPRIGLGDVLDLTAASAQHVLADAPPALLTIPDLGPGDPAQLMLRTTVTVHGAIVLREYESGITYPKFVHALGRLEAGQEVRVGYRCGTRPGFECRLTTALPGAGGHV